jgi:quercetin dioxygenase-like cupin family protein
MYTRFFTQQTALLHWADARDITRLPPGSEFKLLRRDPEDDDAREFLVRCPPGSVEERHTHSDQHAGVIIEGSAIVDGKTLGPGDYIFAPRNVEHGPIEYPDGVLMVRYHRGDPSLPVDGSGTAEFLAINTEELPWVDAGAYQELPPGQENKILRRDPDDDDAHDILVRFTDGYVEPRHTHAGEHIVTIVHGKMLIDGKTQGPGDYVYGPRDVDHGEFVFTNGIVLFAAHRGSAAHEYENKDKLFKAKVTSASAGGR